MSPMVRTTALATPGNGNESTSPGHYGDGAADEDHRYRRHRVHADAAADAKPACTPSYSNLAAAAPHRCPPRRGRFWVLWNADGIIELAYFGQHKATLAAKALIQAFYRQPQKFAYMQWCSEVVALDRSAQLHCRRLRALPA